MARVSLREFGISGVGWRNLIGVTKQAYRGFFVDIDAVSVLSVEYEGVADVQFHYTWREYVP